MKRKIQLSSNAVTADQSFVSSDRFAERSESVSERVNKWFIEPLKRMKGTEGFLVLLVLFPLYEKHLRNRYAMGDENFTEGHPIFCTVGKHLKLSNQNAYVFWWHVRNGLLHRAAPKTSEDFEYGIRANGPPVEIVDGRFWINPFALRDRLLEEIEPDMRSWKTDDVPLAKTFDRIGL